MNVQLDKDILSYRISTIQENFEKFPMKCNWCDNKFNAVIPRVLHMIDKHRKKYTKALLG